MLTGRQSIRYAIDKELGGPGFDGARRLREAIIARRCRNVFFNAIGAVITNSVATRNIDIKAQTPAFGTPIIITDILNYTGDAIAAPYWTGASFLSQIFTTQDAGQDDLFGASGLIDVKQMLSHDRNHFNGGSSGSFPVQIFSPSNKMHFMPYLLKVGQILSMNWRVVSSDTVDDINSEVDFRGVMVLGANDEYGQLCGRLKDSVCSYIKDSEPETFILDVTVPATTFAAGTEQTVNFATEPQGRPLLVLGINSNINGVQVSLRDPSTHWQFCIPGVQPTVAISAGAPVTYAGPQLNGVPLYLLASNPEMTNRDAYNMFPVPHLLEPNTSLIFKLTQGLRPRALVQTFQQTFNTTGLFDPGDGIGKISLLCRTV